MATCEYAIFRKDTRELNPPVWHHCQTVYTALLPLLLGPDCTQAWWYASNHQHGMERQCPELLLLVFLIQPQVDSTQTERKMRLWHLTKLGALCTEACLAEQASLQGHDGMVWVCSWSLRQASKRKQIHLSPKEKEVTRPN